MLEVTRSDWRALFPSAPQAVIDAFASSRGMSALQQAGILETRQRLAYALANVEHECGGFTIPALTENIGYTHARMAQVWPNRFKSAADVAGRYGIGHGWQLKAFDDIYGNRMGNRAGTSDGSRYIGRGCVQITGRDGYREIGKRCGLDLLSHPELACLPEHQPAILAAYWSWKRLNRFADKNDWLGCVKAWNGGTNGMADRNAMMRGNEPIIARLQIVASLAPVIDAIPNAAPAAPSTKITTQTTIGSGGGAAVITAAQNGASPAVVAAIVVVTVLAMVGAYLILRKRRRPAAPVVIPNLKGEQK